MGYSRQECVHAVFVVSLSQGLQDVLKATLGKALRAMTINVKLHAKWQQPTVVSSQSCWGLHVQSRCNDLWIAAAAKTGLTMTARNAWASACPALTAFWEKAQVRVPSVT